MMFTNLIWKLFSQIGCFLILYFKKKILNIKIFVFQVLDYKNNNLAILIHLIFLKFLIHTSWKNILIVFENYINIIRFNVGKDNTI